MVLTDVWTIIDMAVFGVLHMVEVLWQVPREML